jgi:hypothetical protein
VRRCGWSVGEGAGEARWPSGSRAVWGRASVRRGCREVGGAKGRIRCDVRDQKGREG